MSYYYPSALVRHVHRIPHLDRTLQPSSNEFYITQNSPWNSYTQSLLTLPIIIGCIGWTAVILVALTFIFRSCCNLCRTAPKDIDLAQADLRSAVTWADTVSNKRTSLARKFFYVCMVIIIADQLLFYGNYFIAKGVRKADIAVAFAEGLGQSFYDSAHDLQDNIEDFETNLAAGADSCEYLENVDDTIGEYSDYVDTYVEFVEPIPYRMAAFSDTFNSYGHQKKDAVIWTLYCSIFVVIMAYCVGIGTQKKSVLKGAIVFGLIIMLTFIVICCLEMALLVGLADFCMDPLTYGVQFISSETTQSIAQYYATCEGDDPIYGYLNTAYTAFVDLNSSLPALLDYCEGNQYLLNLISDTNVMVRSLELTQNAAQCSAIQSEWNSVFNEGLCNDAFKGFFIVWIVKFILIFFLFSLTSTVSMLYEYFGKLWNIDKDEVLLQSLEENDPFKKDISGRSFATDEARTTAMATGGIVGGNASANPLYENSGHKSLQNIKNSFSSARTTRVGSGRVPDTQYNAMYKPQKNFEMDTL